MIQIDGKIKLRKGEAIEYDKPTLEIVPYILSDFSGMNIDLNVYLPQVDADGLPVLDENDNPILLKITTKGYTFASSDLSQDEPQIMQTLEKLKTAIEKRINRDLKEINPDLKNLKNGSKR